MTTGQNISSLIKKPFEPSSDDFAAYRGEDFSIIRELELGSEVDPCVAPMFKIKFSDGNEVAAYPDEILTDESMGTIFTPEFLAEYR